MDTPVTYDELAQVMETCAGVSVDAAVLAAEPDVPFSDIGLDSLGVIGVIAELENRYAAPIGGDADSCRTPRQLITLVNSQLTSGV